jgi:hypothetical protein
MVALRIDQELRDEVEVLVATLYREVGKSWMSIGLRLQLEKIEELLRTDPPDVFEDFEETELSPDQLAEMLAEYADDEEEVVQ